MRNLSLLIFIVIVFIIGCKKDNQTPGDLSVTLTSIGYGIQQLVKGATVFTVPATKEGITDDNGNVVLKDLPPGEYKVYAKLDGFGSGAGTIGVNSGLKAQLNMLVQVGTKLGFTPNIQYFTPYDHEKFSVSDKIEIAVLVTDDNTLPQDLKVVISSDLDGKLFETHPDSKSMVRYVATSLSQGNHMIKVTATDRDNYTSICLLNVITSYPGNVVLDTAYVTGNNVQLNWEKYLLNDLDHFEIYRAMDQYAQGQVIASVTTAETVSYLDKYSPYLGEVYYYIKAVNKFGEVRNSNKKKVTNPAGKFFPFYPFDAVHHPSKQIVYVVDNTAKKLRAINYATNTEINNVTFNGTAGKIDIGDNGYGVEIYVPTSAGYVYVYDANTLDLNATILTGGTPVSVVTNGKGYMVVASWDKKNRTYSRKSGISLDGFGFYANYLRMVPNTDNIVLISLGVYPTQAQSYQLTGSGVSVKYTNLIDSENFPCDPNYFRISPDGLYMVTSQSGGVYTLPPAFAYKGNIFRGAMWFSDFAFSPDGSKIYAGTSNKASIQVVNYPVLTATTEILTKGYPRIMFYYNGEVVSVGLGIEGGASFGIDRIKVN